ncbi:hypothetical protein [Thomasclavelia cocleata]|uniref:hypothetical protein n=1 Tax=Thomasclavelia cocleata TaxID=69824 RepID=UPI00256F168B|nr:hypothetical protein [Thomasclavelia cocleata]
MNELKEIRAEDLLFTNEIEDDRTNTYLSLDDYDWMSYKLRTRFKTKEQGILDVEFEYFGLVSSQMTVKQTLDDEIIEYTYEYNTDIFQKHITIFLQNHIKAWDSTYAFNGEDEVINFFNEVLHEGFSREDFYREMPKERA